MAPGAVCFAVFGIGVSEEACFMPREKFESVHAYRAELPDDP